MAQLELEKITELDQTSSLMMLLGELRADTKNILHNQQAMADRIQKVEEKTADNQAFIHSVSKRQNYIVAYAAGVGAAISGFILIFKEKIAHFFM